MFSIKVLATCFGCEQPSSGQCSQYFNIQHIICCVSLPYQYMKVIIPSACFDNINQWYMLDIRLVCSSGFPYAPRPLSHSPSVHHFFSFFHHLQRHYKPCRCQRPLLTREEIGREMAGKFSLWPNFHVVTGFFNMPQICNMGQMALLLFRRKACWGFFCLKNSNSFGRVWTHELRYQRPAC
jgi:hypothetical protein